jgi:hypothetical protein
MASIVHLIQMIKPRPPMYIGRSSLSCLRAFIDGWSFAHEGRVDDATVLHEFQGWVARKCGVKEDFAWDRVILFVTLDEPVALTTFFEWFDEFLADKQRQRV